jgi:hypothetical protein
MTPLGILFSIKLYDELKRIKGTVEIPNFNQRKIKYMALAVFGVLAPILFILFVSTTVVSMLSSYY